jgi:hypothetical protein
MSAPTRFWPPALVADHLAVDREQHVVGRSALWISHPDRIGHRVGLGAAVLERLEFQIAAVE